MPIDLMALLSKFKSVSSRETDLAFFLTNVPAVAPLAYLSVLFKAAPQSVVASIDKELNLPTTLLDFYRQWNGAHFFVNAFSVYGCVPIGQLLVRSDPFKLPPFSVLKANQELSRKMDMTELLCIGVYGLDGSRVCLNRESQSIVCFAGEDLSTRRFEWRNLEHWLTDELARLSMMFDPAGNRLVDEEELLPGGAGSGVH